MPLADMQVKDQINQITLNSFVNKIDIVGTFASEMMMLSLTQPQ